MHTPVSWLPRSTLAAGPLILLLALACGPAAAPTATPTSTATGTVGTPAPTSTPTPTPTAAPRRGGTLTAAVTLDASTLDPHTGVSGGD